MKKSDVWIWNPVLAKEPWYENWRHNMIAASKTKDGYHYIGNQRMFRCRRCWKYASWAEYETLSFLCATCEYSDRTALKTTRTAL